MTAEAVNSHAGDDLPPKRSRGGVTSGASLGCEAVDSHAGDDLPPKRSRGGVTSGAAHRLRSRQLSCWRRPAAEAEPRGRYLWSQPWLRSRRFSCWRRPAAEAEPRGRYLWSRPSAAKPSILITTKKEAVH